LVASVNSTFPGSRHIRDFKLTQEDDEPIWQFAGENGFMIVSKDTDFMHRALLRGHPPKVIHLRVGNCSTDQIAQLLHRQSGAIKAFANDPLESLLSLH
jgi:predicted nuclease of predicted toxin-antitoxin system